MASWACRDTASTRPSFDHEVSPDGGQGELPDYGGDCVAFPAKPCTWPPWPHLTKLSGGVGCPRSLSRVLKAMRIVATFILVLSGVVGLGQEISGIGVLLANDFKVNEVIPDSPASASKAIHRGDRIIAIAQGDQPPVQITGLKLVEAVRLIRGPKGSVVRVTIVPSGQDDSEAQVIRIVRGELKGVNDRAAIGDLGLQLWFFLLRLGVALAHP